MRVDFVTEEHQKQWEELVSQGDFVSGRFLQAWAWGEFRRALGYKIFRLGAFEKGILKGACFLERRSVGFGQSYLYLPRGPAVCQQEPGLFFKILRFGQALAQKERSFLVRWDLPFKARARCKQHVGPWRLLKQLHFQDIGNQVEPKYTLILNLRQPTERLRDRLAPRVKRNLNRARRYQVRARELEVKPRGQGLRIFLELLRATEQRQKIDLHSQSSYFEKMFEKFGDHLRLFVAEYQGRPTAGALVVTYADAATYLYGGSIRMKQNIGAPWLLHWEIIKRMKQSGYSWYDFWGIGQKQADGSFWPAGWEGLTFFKTGFGGQKIEYLGAYDWPARPLIYKLYQFLR